MIPIGTDIQARRVPVANIAIIVANVGIYLLTDVIGGAAGEWFKRVNTLDAARPVLHQYITYQFLHGDIGHLAGNMLFLWVFGNAVCDKMGALCYGLFYLAGGVFAGVVYAAGSSTPMLGASGAIAAVTTAFLVLFPRSRVTILLLFIFITTFELPSIVLIVFKIILWDNVIAPSFNRGISDHVAYSAHLGGYAFGLAAGIALLASRALARNQFDLLALWSRQWRRAALAPGGTVRPAAARPVVVAEYDGAGRDYVPTEADAHRAAVLDALDQRDVDQAAQRYLALVRLDERQVLPRQAQLDVAAQLVQVQAYADAARAYESFLRAYPGANETPQVRLLLGMILNRHLRDPAAAAEHLRIAACGLLSEPQRALALDELRAAEAALGG